MGAWGFHSDECDPVYDFIGIGISGRAHGVDRFFKEQGEEGLSFELVKG